MHMHVYILYAYSHKIKLAAVHEKRQKKNSGIEGGFEGNLCSLLVTMNKT